MAQRIGVVALVISESKTRKFCVMLLGKKIPNCLVLLLDLDEMLLLSIDLAMKPVDTLLFISWL